MKAGRNDPCPCGSGKKYKKCCLGKNREASATPALAASPSSLSAAGSGSDPLDTLKAALATAKAREAKTPKPPRDPAIERAENRFKDFEAQAEEGRIALFQETLKDAELMDDEMAFAMLGQLHTDAAKRGERLRFAELVNALRNELPGVYDEGAHYYLSWRLLDALAEGRQEVVPSLTQELAIRAGRDLDSFVRSREYLEYHGQLSVLMEAHRVALPGVKSIQDSLVWGLSSFTNYAANLEIFDHLERSSSPDPTDPVLLKRIKYYVDQPDVEYLRDFIGDLTGTSGREWRADDFVLSLPRNDVRDGWDDDEEDKDEEEEPSSPGEVNLSRLISEFVGYWRREGAPFPLGNMVREELYSYFLRRHAGDLDPRPSMFEQAANPRKRLPKPPRPAHPLCPDRVTLEVCLAGLMGFMSGKYHTAAALFQAMPAWLRFLESRRLIDSELRKKVTNGLLPLHITLLKGLQDFTDDPTLYLRQQAWPGDAAREPRDSGP